MDNYLTAWNKIRFLQGFKECPSVPRDPGATAGEKAGRSQKRGANKLTLLNSVQLADVSCFGPL